MTIENNAWLTDDYGRGTRGDVAILVPVACAENETLRGSTAAKPTGIMRARGSVLD